MKYSNLYPINMFAALLLLCACSDAMMFPDADSEQSNIIHVGAGIDDELEISSSVTRAAADADKGAERQLWLVQPLKQGLDITYGSINSSGNHENERVAILRLMPGEGGTAEDDTYKTDETSGYAEYTFKYRSDTDGQETNEPARWYDNGLHFFEGVHVPNRIRYINNASDLLEDRDINEHHVSKVVNFTSDQSKDVKTGTDNNLSNYYLLSHYLGMPANTQISATVARIKLPFRHRMARVLAYILIDPELKTNGVNAKIKGYGNVAGSGEEFRDDPTTSEIRFCNVDVLEGVHDVYHSETQVHTLTPTWIEKQRKVVPHFHKQLDTFQTYESEKKTWYEGSTGFPATCPTGFKPITYNNVPVYDLIVRPTYTSANTVMYDEDLGGLTKQQYASKNNQIDFTVSLDNGLTYEKHFEFDLDANYQTIVYLKITRESVDYNESGSQLWVETKQQDQWYGVDNQNGNTLSKAGSSWQRAFYNLESGFNDKITDGGFYDEKTTGEDGTPGQYVSDATWIKNFAQAYEGGAHHGDYFVLAKDITIDARSLPDNFVFTGHLDGWHLDGFNTHKANGYHTITVEHAGQSWKEYIETTDYTSDIIRYDTKPAQEFSDELRPVFALPTLYTKTHHDAVYYTKAECNTYNATLENARKPGVAIKEPEVEEVKYTQEDIDAAGAIVNAEGYVLGTDPEAEDTAKKTAGDIKIEHKDAVYYNETECNEYNAKLPDARTTSTIKKEAYDTYDNVNPNLEEVMTGSTPYYIKNEDESYSEYSKPTVLYTMNQHTSGTALFAGLNGKYTTTQESAADPYAAGVKWEANVHKEGNNWFPYKDSTTGWRAELLNLTVSGCKMFKDDAEITGNVENCKYIIEGVTSQVPNHTPAYPKYK